MNMLFVQINGPGGGLTLDRRQERLGAGVWPERRAERG